MRIRALTVFEHRGETADVLADVADVVGLTTVVLRDLSGLRVGSPASITELMSESDWSWLRIGLPSVEYRILRRAERTRVIAIAEDRSLVPGWLRGVRRVSFSDSLVTTTGHDPQRIRLIEYLQTEPQWGNLMVVEDRMEIATDASDH